MRKPEPAISRVLSSTTIHLGQLSPAASSNLPGSPFGTDGGPRPILPYLVLLRAGFTVPRSVTSRAVRSYRTFSPLPANSRRYIFCGTFHGLTPPRRYLAPCPKEPGLSSAVTHSDCLADSGSLPAHFTGTRQAAFGQSQPRIAGSARILSTSASNTGRDAPIPRLRQRGANCLISLTVPFS